MSLPVYPERTMTWFELHEDLRRVYQRNWYVIGYGGVGIGNGLKDGEQEIWIRIRRRDAGGEK